MNFVLRNNCPLLAALQFTESTTDEELVNFFRPSFTNWSRERVDSLNGEGGEMSHFVVLYDKGKVKQYVSFGEWILSHGKQHYTVWPDSLFKEMYTVLDSEDCIRKDSPIQEVCGEETMYQKPTDLPPTEIEKEWTEAINELGYYSCRSDKKNMDIVLKKLDYLSALYSVPNFGSTEEYKTYWRLKRGNFI